MHKKKIVRWLIFLVLLVVIIIAIVFRLKKKEEVLIDNTNLVISKKVLVEDYQYVESFGNYLFVSNNEALGAINEDGQIKVDFIYDVSSGVIANDELVIVNSDYNYYLYDKDLNLVAASDEVIGFVDDIASEETYYYVGDKVYNLEKQLVYDGVDGYFQKADDYIFLDEKLINIKTNEEIKISSFGIYNDSIYAVDAKKKNIYIYDFEEKELEKFKIEETYWDGFLLSKDNKKYNYTDLHGLIDSEEIIDVGDYEFNYSKCEYGFKVESNGIDISDECFNNYNSLENSKAVVLTSDDGSYILYDNNLRESNDEINIVGDFITKYNFEDSILEVYDLNYQKIDNSVCYSDIEYVGENRYICNDGAKSFFIDREFNKLSDDYDTLFCLDDSNYCVYAKDNKYGVLESSEELIPPIYDYIYTSWDNKKIIGDSFWSFEVFYLDYDVKLAKEELIENTYRPYENINVEEMIKKYNLERLRALIEDNETLFKKYAYIVENNNNLGEYKNKVMDLFREVAENKKFLNESYFWESLQDLNIVTVEDMAEEGYVGLYYDGEKKIELLDDEDNVVYHELTHFVDYSFDSSFGGDVYWCVSRYVSKSEYEELNSLESNHCELVISEEANFMVEGGAEYFSGIYLNNNVLRVYDVQTNIIGALSYIYGYDTLNDIFFDKKDGYYNLFMLFNEAGVSVEEYLNFLKITSRFYTLKDRDYFIISDVLIKLYEAKSPLKWYDNNEFSEIITLITGYRELKSSYTVNYNDYLRLDYDFYNKYKKILGEEVVSLASLPAKYLRTDKGVYYVFNIYYEDGYDTLIYEYDFINDRVKSKSNIIFRKN